MILETLIFMGNDSEPACRHDACDTAKPARIARVPDNDVSRCLAHVRELIGSGEFARAAQQAASWSIPAGQSTEALRLRTLAECLQGNLDGAAALIAGARSSQGGEAPALSRLAVFIEDQRRAHERADAYNAFVADSSDAMRWHSGRTTNLEIYPREGLYEDMLSALATAGRQVQRYAVSPADALSLAKRLTAASDALTSAALAESPPLVFLSDSHSRYFEWLVFEGLVPQRAAGVCSVSEANLYGLYMPSRKVPTRKRFREALDRFPPQSIVVLHIGEVDCRAVYWNLRERLGAFGRGFFESVTDNFKRLLDEIAATHPRIVVTAPVRPTYLSRPEDRMVDGDLILQLTRGLSAHMETVCADRGFGFVTINPDLEEFGAGLGNRYFRTVQGKREVTHHLSAPKVAGLWARALAPHLK